MSRGTKILIYAVILALILLGYVAATKLYDRSLSGEKDEDEFLILPFTAGDVVAYTWDFEGETYTVSDRDGDGVWVWDGDPSIELDPSRTHNMQYFATNVYGVQKIENVENINEYGITEDQIGLTYTLKNGEEYELVQGNYNGIVGKYYTMFTGTDIVYLSDNSFKLEFDCPVDEFFLDK